MHHHMLVTLIYQMNYWTQWKNKDSRIIWAFLNLSWQCRKIKNYNLYIFSDTSSPHNRAHFILCSYRCTIFLHRIQGTGKYCPSFWTQIYSNNRFQTWLQIWRYTGKIERYGWTNVTNTRIHTRHARHTWCCRHRDITIAMIRRSRQKQPSCRQCNQSLLEPLNHQQEYTQIWRHMED